MGKLNLLWLMALLIALPCRPGAGQLELGSFEVRPEADRPELAAAYVPSTRKVMLHDRPSADQPVAVVSLAAAAGNSAEVDETHGWERHTIETDLGVYGMWGFDRADIDGDGKLDVLFCLSARRLAKPHDGVYWYKVPEDPRNGTWLRRRLTSPEYPIRWSMALATGDVDNDGDIDVVALSFDNSNVYLALNQLNEGGDVNQPWRTLVILESPGVHRDGERVELVDIDGDGYKDVVFPRGLPGERGVRILFNPSGKPSENWRQRQIGVHEAWDAHDVMSVDLDSDGDLDIVFSGGSGDTTGDVYWYEHPDGNPRNGAWVRHRVSPIEPVDTYGGLKIEDIDRDGRPDILVTEAHGDPGRIMWYKNPVPATGIWNRYEIGTQFYPHVSALFDIDGDGLSELWVPDCSFMASGHFGQRKGGLVYFKRGADPTEPWVKHRVAYPPEVGRPCLAMDVDGDGDLDVVCGADLLENTGSLVWWENRLER